MKIKENYVLKEVADTFIVVPVGTGDIDFNTLVTLNETGAFLWKILEKGATKEELLEKLLGEYDVTAEKASEDLDKFIKKISDAGLTV